MCNVVAPMIKVVVALTISVAHGQVRKSIVKKSKMSGL